MSKRRLLIGSIALAVGGLAPMMTGVVGLYGYFTQGYFISRSGQNVSGTTAWVSSSIFVLAGLGMMAIALWQYRKRTGRRSAEPDQK
jgi:ABC-type transport system involved in multi-copper enzyme maturation permease subunit